MKAVRILLIGVAMVVALAFVAPSASAQEEPVPQPTPFDLVTVPVTITVGGPAQAVAGSQVTFTIDYAFSAPNPLTDEYRVGFSHMVNPATYFVSSEILSGDGECSLHEQQPLGRDWVECEVGSDSARSGRLAVTLSIDSDYAGPLNYGVYMRGTSIRFEPGSVETWTTEVVAPEPANVRICVSSHDLGDEPVVSAEMTPLPEGATVEVANGCAMLSNFPPGDYHLVLEMRGGMFSDDITLAPGDAGTLTYQFALPVPDGLPITGTGWQRGSGGVALFGWAAGIAVGGLLLVGGSAFAVARRRG